MINVSLSGAGQRSQSEFIEMFCCMYVAWSNVVGRESGETPHVR